MSKGIYITRCATQGCDKDITKKAQYGSKKGWICEDCQNKKIKDEKNNNNSMCVQREREETADI